VKVSDSPAVDAGAVKACEANIIHCVLGGGLHPFVHVIEATVMGCMLLLLCFPSGAIEMWDFTFSLFGVLLFSFSL